MEAIPPESRQEWQEIVRGNIKFNKTVLQLLADRLKRNVENEDSDMFSAVTELHTFFKKYKNAYRKDLELIFGPW